MSDDALLDELLAKPVGPQTAPRQRRESDTTRELEISGDTAKATVPVTDEDGPVNEGTGLRFLESEGQNPDDWEVTHFRKIEYGNPEQPYSSVKFTFKRKVNLAPLEIPLDDLVTAVEDYAPVDVRPQGSHGFVVLIGDMQFGKIDGDGPAGTLARTIECINRAADTLAQYRKLYDIGHVHVAWLGDHIEGFVSQGGANVWRTQLTLNEQIRLTRRVMLHALKTFAPLASTVSMVAVPGNHGESVRFEGTGLTRYDDSHDTESLIAVAEVADMMPESFGHVRFQVPDTDELIVISEVAGTIIAHAHGHKWRVGKALEWWRGQAFNRDSGMHMADVLVAGHLHHEHVESDGSRVFVQVPALESESTWWRHTKGTGGAPGIIVGLVKDGRFDLKQVVRAEVCK